MVCGMVDESRVIERAFHISKLTLLEIAPLYPFLHGRDELRVMEVGANVGLWCEAFHDVFGHRVVSYQAFEPMPGNAERFEKRAADRGYDVKLTVACAGPTMGEVTIHYDREVTTLASVPVPHMEFKGTTIDNKHSMVVPQTTLDRAATGPVDLVKIDTEGYEWDVIQGAKWLIDSGKADNIYFEFGAHQGEIGQTFAQFFEFFTSRGWKIYRQAVSRNYYGLNEVRRMTDELEDTSSMWMILASRLGPSPAYRGPRVVGRIN